MVQTTVLPVLTVFRTCTSVQNFQTDPGKLIYFVLDICAQMSKDCDQHDAGLSLQGGMRCQSLCGAVRKLSQ